jgi:hypothetical protein
MRRSFFDSVRRPSGVVKPVATAARSLSGFELGPRSGAVARGHQVVGAAPSDRVGLCRTSAAASDGDLEVARICVLVAL